MISTDRVIRVAIVMAGLAGPAFASAQERADLDVMARIREEGFRRSQVMDFAWYMTDVLGPRLTGSPGLKRAQRRLDQRIHFAPSAGADLSAADRLSPGVYAGNRRQTLRPRPDRRPPIAGCLDISASTPVRSSVDEGHLGPRRQGRTWHRQTEAAGQLGRS